jgi:anti-anti-sigma factor
VSDAGPALATTAWDGHLLLLHRSEGDRLARLAAWVSSGLAQGEKVICTNGRAEDGSVLAHLREYGIDVGAATAEGQLELLPIDAFYPPDGQEAVVDRVLDEGFPALRMTAEAHAVRTVLSPEAHLDIERKTDELCRTRPVSAMCQYARPATTGPLLRDAVATHVSGVRELAFSSGENELGLVLHGEVDIANADVLAATLAAALGSADASGRDAVRVDLEGVAFFGAAACRAIVTVSEAFREGGGRLVLVAPQPGVERVLRLVGVHTMPGCELVGDAT